HLRAVVDRLASLLVGVHDGSPNAPPVPAAAAACRAPIAVRAHGRSSLDAESRRGRSCARTPAAAISAARLLARTPFNLACRLLSRPIGAARRSRRRLLRTDGRKSPLPPTCDSGPPR